MNKINLNNNWEIRNEELLWGPEMSPMVLAREDGWLDAHLPCDIHMPLIEKFIIKEPLEADNSFDCEWTEDKSWWFRKIFSTDQDLLKADIIELTLESLDAEADIFLNGFHLSHHRSAFYPYKENVKQYLKIGENILLVRLSSGVEHFSDLDISGIKKFVGTEDIHNRGDKRRVFIRKPQYVYGWDWGPRVVTCGIMKSVYLEAFGKIAIRSVNVVTKSVSRNAVVGFEIEIENLHPYSTFDSDVTIEIFDGDNKVERQKQSVLLRSGLNFIVMDALIKDAKLWWPNGMGGQPLYLIKASAKSGSIETSYTPFKFGIRTVSLDQARISDDERRFAFEINGVKVFCKGGNWIPADSIYSRVSIEKYDTLIREAKEANFNMLRVWGGGIYESDIFYEKCDEYGILIWHDFMFACAVYPDNLEWFRNEVEKEMDYQTRRLRNHASLVLWCGNNENHWGFDEWWNYENKPLQFGGSICYNNIAPRLIRKNCPEIPYWNSSPYGGEHPNGNNVGDRHHWQDCTMNPDMDKRITPEEYDKVSAKFISEYGYIGPCRKSSIIKYHGDTPVDKNGRIWKLHNNTFESETVPAGIAKHYTEPEKLDIDAYLLYAGLCQGLMYSYSLEAIRFKENCWGSLFWMYDDCWGEVGWTIIDYYLKRKISYYFVKRAFAPMKIILREENCIIKVMGINETPEVCSFNVEYGYMTFDGEVKDNCKTLIKLEPYSRSVVLNFNKGPHDFFNGFCYVKPEPGSCDILPVILRQNDFMELRIPEAALKITNILNIDNTIRFTVTSDVYSHAVHFSLDDHIRLSDEYFDLLPGESREVVIFDVPGKFSIEDIKPKCIMPVSN